MTDIVTAATKVAKRLRDSDENPSDAEIASTIEEATGNNQSESSAFKQYAKKAAIFGAIALARRYLSQNQQGIDEDATRVEVVDPDEREASDSRSKSTSESEKSSGGMFSLKRLAFLGVLAGAGYVAVKKLRSKGEQHTLEEWDEPSTATESGTAGETGADEEVGAAAGGTEDTAAPSSESESEDVSDHDVDIGAGEAEDEDVESNATTDPTEVADGEPVNVDEDESTGGSGEESVGADPDEVAVEEGDEGDEDEDEDERLSQSE